MKEDLITIIVPVYKVEKYLNKCIESIIKQTYRNIEIILVDDGSPDNCGKICDEYALKDNRIIVIHKENGGLSDARNKGMDIAKGEYLFFVDSDDYIEDYTIEYLYSLARQYEADVIVGQENRVYEVKEGEYKKFTTLKEGKEINIYNNEQALETMLYNSEFTNKALNKLCRKELFDNIRFPVGKLYEDLATIYKVIAIAEKVVLGAKITYNYFDRDSSIMNSKFDLKRMQGLEFAEEILEFVKVKFPSIEKSAISRLYMECIFILLKIPYKKEFKNQNRKIKDYLRKYRWIIITNKKMPKKQKLLCITAIFGRLPLRMVWNLKENAKKNGK